VHSMLLPGKVPADHAASKMNPSLLPKHLPRKAYHDEPLLRLQLMGTVPCALIVFAVLS
jgi:hypothetical protein